MNILPPTNDGRSSTTRRLLRRAFITFTAASLLMSASSGYAAQPAESAHARCLAIRQDRIVDADVRVADWVDASTLPLGPGGSGVAVPAHCLLRLLIGARSSDLPDLSYGTGIELRLPADWNGRLLFQGGGGMNGLLLPAVGRLPGFPSALERGFAVVSTDGGHQGRSNIDSRFGRDQQARLDFGFGAIATTTREAKSMLRAYYGRKPDRSYFMGCSTGGREAMMAAQRLPLEFDGVVSGNAAWNLTRLVVGQIWSLQAVNRIAPRKDGRPDLSSAFTDEQLEAVSAGALQRCDALDGLRDGMINDFQACNFSPKSLTCGTAGAPSAGRCLSTGQVSALEKIFGGARNSRGERLHGTFPFDTGIAQPAWRGMHLGTNGGPPANATLGADTLRNYVLTPPAPDLDPLQFDFDRDFTGTLETAAINDATGTEHSTFAGRGGKLIAYLGLSDQAMSTGSLVEWYGKVTPRDTSGPQSWARLFFIPGMTHCGGGRSTDEFDMLDAIQKWVERGEAPERILATGKAFPGASRPLCPFPKVARYESGDVDDASSFQCR
ncbi:MAG: tannase/feruloyl esterase family alpha/beta hydrolase [Steroidobacteraceae bacterium]